MAFICRSMLSLSNIYFFPSVYMVGCATRAKCSSTNQNAHDMHVAYDIKPEFKSLVIGSTHGIPKSDHYTKQYFLLYIGNNLLLIRQ